MWDDVLDQAVADGLNLIQIYTFWNYHEPVKGEYYWGGNGDIRLFLKKCADRGLFVNMRIGPYSILFCLNSSLSLVMFVLNGIMVVFLCGLITWKVFVFVLTMMYGRKR